MSMATPTTAAGVPGASGETRIRPLWVDNHFAAWQEPELFTTEVRAAFKSFRDKRRSS
jgi:hypothetical protein